MKIINTHKRMIHQPKEKVVELLSTLATENDKIWPNEQWPPMRFREGKKIGSKGGHGIVRYSITKYIPDEIIQFEFSKPEGFNGHHSLNIVPKEDDRTELIHQINAELTFRGYFTWILFIKWLHDALIEDAFDKVENNFTEEKKKTKWNLWVRLLRWGAGLK